MAFEKVGCETHPMTHDDDPIRPAFGWVLLLDGGLLALALVALLPSLAMRVRRSVPIPSDRVLRMILIVAVLTHLGEGIAAAFMASRRGRDVRGWALQTAIVGFPSLRLLAKASDR